MQVQKCFHKIGSDDSYSFIIKFSFHIGNGARHRDIRRYFQRRKRFRIPRITQKAAG